MTLSCRYHTNSECEIAGSVKAATEACRAQRLENVRQEISRESPGTSGARTACDVLALGLIERSSRGLLQSSNMVEQLRRTTKLSHAELAMNKALQQVISLFVWSNPVEGRPTGHSSACASLRFGPSHAGQQAMPDCTVRT